MFITINCFKDKLRNIENYFTKTIAISSISEYYPASDNEGITELCTGDGDVIYLDEPYRSFDRRVKEESGQEPRETWTLHQSEDEIVKIRTYHN